MEAKFSRPVDIVTLYRHDVQGKVYLPSELEALLQDMEQSVDEAYAELQKGGYAVVDYQINFLDSRALKRGKTIFLGDFIMGGFDMSIREGREISLPMFQERYKRSFKKFREEYHGQKINIHAYIYASKGRILEIMKIKSPEELEKDALKDAKKD